jgi:hypothetical protein
VSFHFGTPFASLLTPRRCRATPLSPLATARLPRHRSPPHPTRNAASTLRHHSSKAPPSRSCLARAPLHTGPLATDLATPRHQGWRRQPCHHGHPARGDHGAERVVCAGGRRSGRRTCRAAPAVRPWAGMRFVIVHRFISFRIDLNSRKFD